MLMMRVSQSMYGCLGKCWVSVPFIESILVVGKVTGHVLVVLVKCFALRERIEGG